MAFEHAGQDGNPAPGDPVTPALPRPGSEAPPGPPLDKGETRNGAAPSLPPQPPQDLAGHRLGQYTVLKRIGQGGMGSVFEAFDTALERTVALKVLFSSPVDDPRQAERFLREARSLARLSHPNLLHVYNVGREGDCYYFAMELLPGETLSAALRRGRLPAQEFLPCLGQILSALHYVHLQGIMHRDVKSGNIMLCARRAVLMDFGLAKDEAASGLTSVGAVLGTPDYMPPELAQGAAAGPPTDIYSVGVVMYEALTGALPFSGRSAMTIIRQHLEVPPPPLRRALPDIDPRLEAIVHRCLAKRPADRYPHCAALAADLVKVLNTAELAALAAEKPDFSSRPSLKRALSVPVQPAAAEATVAIAASGAAASSGGPLDATVLDTRTAVSGQPAPAGALDATLPRATTAPGLAPQPGPAGMPALLPSPVPGEVVQGARRWHAWAWVAGGFFGVLLLALVLMNLRRGANRLPAPWPGQPARLRKADGSSEEIRWVEFKAGDADPSKWQHVIERKQPDGTWARVTVPHRALIQGEMTLEMLPLPGGAQRK